MKLPIIVLLILFALAFAQWQDAYPRLPDRIATHFDGAGHPNGWSSKDSFGIIMAVILGLFLLPMLVTIAIVGKVPDHLINLPRKDYWLAPERRAETISFINRQLLWMSVGFVAFGVYVNHLVIEANLVTPPRLSANFLWALVALLVALAIWLVRFIRSFTRIPAEAHASRP